MKVTILTAALPQRLDMLEEAIASIDAQVCPGVEVEHLFSIDVDREGAAPILNRLLAISEGDWVMVLDDDDLLDPSHVATVLGIDDLDRQDVVYSMPRVLGGEFTNYETPFEPLHLARRNIVSHTAMMRRSLVEQVKGWNAVRWFDWDLFCRLEQVGARFCRLDAVTWTYRLHGSNWSQGTLEGAPA